MQAIASLAATMATEKEISPTVSDTNSKESSTVTAENRVIPSRTESHSTLTWRKIVGLIWDTAEGDPEYRKYVQRLDLIFLYVNTLAV